VLSKRRMRMDASFYALTVQCRQHTGPKPERTQRNREIELRVQINQLEAENRALRESVAELQKGSDARHGNRSNSKHDT
jgi:uncharacterized protein YlxW (UPF0749 family)